MRFEAIHTVSENSVSLIGRITYVKTNKRTDDEKDHGKVSSTDIECCDHNNATNNGKQNGYDNMVTVLQASTRRPRDKHGHDEGENGWGCLDEVCGSTREAECCNNLSILLAVKSIWRFMTY